MKNILSLLVFLVSAKAWALDPNHFTITRVTAPYFIVDNNVPSTITQAYVGFEVTNNSNSGTTYSGLKFSITSIGTSVSGQNYSVVAPSSGVINVGTLAPGETKVCYFYVSYPANTTPQATFNVELSDATASSKTQSFTIRNRSSISANAGGTATQTITNQDIIGSIITDDVTYAVGNVQNGDESDFQVAVSSQFDPTKVTLLSTKVTASSVPGIPVNTTDSLYFVTGNGSNGSTITIRWTFKITATNFTTYLLPCAGATSGSTNYKYALNTSLGQGTPVTVSSGANPLTISKTSDQSLYNYNNTATFTITISNPSSYPVTIDKITDELPAGFTYVGLSGGGDVTATNSTTIPSNGATGTISFEAGVSSGGTTSYNVPAGGSLVLIYTATAPSSNASNLTTTARDYVGTTEVGSAQNTVSVSAPLPLHLISFKATSINKFVRLDWVTADESNSSHFEIERSNDNNSFYQIGSVKATGTTQSLTAYTFTDSLPLTGVNNYRLKIFDNDGTYQYSIIVSVVEKPDQITLAKVNNPFNSSINLIINSDKDQSIGMQLLDMSGKLILTKTVWCQNSSNTVIWNGLDALRSGMYLLRIITPQDGTITKKLLKF